MLKCVLTISIQERENRYNTILKNNLICFIYIIIKMKENNNPNKLMLKKIVGYLLLPLLFVMAMSSSSYAVDRYWVGGALAGNWNDATKWSNTSGGSGGFGVPAAGDRAFFDITTGNVVITTPVTCDAIIWTFNGGTLVINNSQSLTVTTDVTMNGAISAGNNTIVTFGGTTNVFNKAVSFGTGTTANFGGTNTFGANVTINGTVGLAVTFNNSTFKGTNNQFSQRYTFTGSTVFDVNTVNTFTAGAFNRTFGDITVKQGATFDLQTSFPATDQFANITLESGTTFKFNGQFSTNTSVTGKLVVNTTVCTTPAKYATITSNFGSTTSIDFSTDQEWNNVLLSNVRNVGTGNIKVKSAGGTLPVALGIEDWSSGGRIVYWVGGTSVAPQNWSDCRNWATSSGGSIAGSTGVDPPTSGLDTVIFDASSFTAGRNIVNMDISGGASIMDWSGVTNTPSWTGASPTTLTITRNLTLSPTMTIPASNTINVLFSSDFNAPNNQITMAGKSFNGNIDFLSGSGAGHWELIDNLSTNNLSRIRINSGILTTNDKPITAGALSANSIGATTRTLNLGASAITITGSTSTAGIVFDMTDLSGTLILNSGTSTVTFDNANAGDITIETGQVSKTLPNFVFTNFLSRTIDINTNAGGRITFKDITVSTNAAPNIILNINGKSAKTYNNITFANNVYAQIDGIADATTGGNNIVSGAVTMGTGSQVSFNNSYTFFGSFTVNGTAGNGIVFTGDVAGMNNIFNGTVNLLGSNSQLTFAQTGNNNFNDNITVGSRAIWSFNSCASCTSTVLTGKDFFVTASCGDDVLINSSGQPTAGAARVIFGKNYNWSSVVAQNLNNAAPGVTVNINLGGTASTGNTNILVAVGAPRTLYWVGGTGNWNDATKWSLVSGSTALPNSPQCPPRLIDDAIFDSNSATGAYNVTMDADGQVNNINFTSTTRVPTLKGIASRTLTVGGNFNMTAAGALVQNAAVDYAGRVIFTNQNPPPATPPTITTWGTAIFADVAFGSASTPAGSAWNLNATGTSGNLTVLNKIEIVAGTLNTNSKAVSCGILDANPKTLPTPTSNFFRALNIGSSLFTVTGTGTSASPDNPAIDLRGTNMNFTTPLAGARFIMPNSGNIVINTGVNTVTLPRIDFTGTTNGGTINITTASSTNRVTFREITLDANRDNTTLNILGTSPKTYSTGFDFGSGAGNDGIILSIDGTTNNALQNIFGGPVVLGRVGATTGIRATINGSNQINSTVTVGATTGIGVVFTGTGNNVVTGAYSVVQAGAIITYSNTGTNTFAGVSLNDNVVFTLTNGGNNNLTGTLVSNSDCNTPATITATTVTANLNATSAQAWTNVIVSNLTSTGALITITSKSLIASGGNFTFAPATRNLYWVGGRSDNTNAPVNNFWSNPNNWSEIDPTTGAYNPTTSPGACNPGSCADNVFFNAGSFVGGTGTKLDVNIDIANALCGNMDWTGATNNPRLTGNSANTLSICGNLVMITAMQADGTGATFAGKVRFVTPTTPIVTNNIFVAGKRFNNIDFESANDASGFLIRDTPTSTDNTLYAVSTVSLIRGILNLNNVTGSDASATPATADINCNAFTTNVASTGDQVRSLVMGANARMLIRGSGTVLDLQGNTNKFTLTSDPTSTIELNNNGNITVNTGTFSKTIPNLDFSTVSSGTITVQGSTTNRITFRKIDVASGTSTAARKTFNMQTNAPKTYGNITVGNNTNSTWDGASNAIVAPPLGLTGTSNLFTGTVTFGTETRARFNSNNYFDQAVLFGSTTNSGNSGDVLFNNNNTFNSTLTFSAAGRGWAAFGNGTNTTTNEFYGAVNFLGFNNDIRSFGSATAMMRFYNILNVVSGCGTGQNSVGDFNTLMEFRDNVTWGNCSGGVGVAQPVQFRRFVDMFTNTPNTKFFTTGTDCRFTFAPYTLPGNPPSITVGGIGNFQNMQHGENNLITYNDWVSFTNYFLTKFDIVLFPRNNNTPAAQPSIIRERLDAVANCNSWIRIASNLPTEQTNLQFLRDHTNTVTSVAAPYRQLEFVLFQDINKTAGFDVNATPKESSDISNNTDYNAGSKAGINFINAATPKIFYWVKSVNQIASATDDTSGDWADELNDNHWSSPSLPVLTGSTGTVGLNSGNGGSGLGPSGCIPTPQDSVVFDNNSVKVGAGAADIVSIDKYSVYSRGQRWSNTKPMILTGQDVYTVHVYGSMTGNALTTNNFGGTYFFTGFDTQNGEIKDIKMNNMRFFGPVVLNNEKDRWIVQDDMNIDNNARGSLTISYGIMDMGGMQNNPAPPKLNLEGDFIMTQRVGSTGFDRNAQFISRNSTVTFDSKGGNNQAIQMDGSQSGSPTFGQMKSTSGTACVECTEYRTTAAAQPDVVKTAGVYSTNPASNLYSAVGVDAQVISCNRSPFYNIVVDKVFNTILNIQSTNGAISLSIYNDLRILNGRLSDNGNQIRGNFSNPLNASANGGVLQMTHNTRLTLGNGGTASVFPTCYRTDNITLAPTPKNLVYGDAAISPTPTNNSIVGTTNFSGINPTLYGGAAAQTSPEVSYIASGNNIRQMVAGVVARNLTNAAVGGTTFAGNVGPTEYGTLTVTGGASGSAAITASKDLTGPTTIQGMFRVGTNSSTVYFRDMGKQITGNAFVNTTAPQTYNMIFIDRNAVLELGTGTTNLTYSAANAPHNTATSVFTPPAATADVSTNFPTYTGIVQDFASASAGTGKMSINAGSTVIYNSGSNQAVLGGISYGNLTVRSAGRTAGGVGLLIDKTVTRHPSVMSTIILTVNGNLLVDVWNNLIDAGWQIQGRATNPVTSATNTLTANANSQLTLGIDNVATVFPTNYTRPNISLFGPTNANLTVYNSGHLATSTIPPANQLMSTTPIYGDITLRDPTPIVGSTNLIEKRFSTTGTVDIKGNLTIERHNHLNDDGNQISRQTVGGIMRMENGWNTTAGLDSANITRITIGNATTSTDFPRNFSTVQIEDNTTVVYNGTPTQKIAGGTASPNFNGAASPDGYFNLWAQSTSSAGNDGIKNLQGAITIRNDFVIRQNVRFNDADSDTSPTAAYQITGSATGNMTMEANSELRLDKWAIPASTAATVFPTNYIRTNTGLHVSSTVIYNSNTSFPTNIGQDVSSRPMYGNITFRRFNGTALVPKTVTTDRTNLDIRGNLRIEANNSLIDNGRQILGTNTGSMFMANTALLSLGTQGGGAIATAFPTNFLSANIDMDLYTDPTTKLTPRAKTAMNTVIYNSDLPQTIAGSGILGTVGPGRISNPLGTFTFPLFYWNDVANSSAYGNIRLSSSAAVTKTLGGTINMRGNLFIDAQNTLDASASNYRIYIGGDWFAAANSDFTARAGRVTFDGYNVNQDITPDGAAFNDIEINKTPNNNRTATLRQQLTVNNEVFYKNGYFVSSTGNEFIYAATAKHNTTEAGTSKQYTTIDAAVDVGTDGPSDNSHIVGPVTRIGVSSTRFFFPVGSGLFYAPVGIKSASTSAQPYTARYYGYSPDVSTPPGPFPTSSINAACATNVSKAEFWTLDNPNMPATPTQVTLSWALSRSGGIAFPASLFVMHYLGSAWNCEGNDGTNTNNSAGGIITSANAVTSFSPFTLGSTVPTNPLPVQLVSFDAKAIAEKKAVELKWTTVEEVNNDFFTLEKSKDGKTFISFKEVASKARTNGRTSSDYSDIDTEPIKGLSYYRLKQTDLDGKTSYSKVVPVYFGSDDIGEIVLYPNPTEGTLNLQIFEKGSIEGSIYVTDILGREVYNEQISNLTSAQSHAIEFKQNLASGAYVLKFVGKNKTYTKTFVVSK